MKISRIRHVLITSVIFLVAIFVIIKFYSIKLDAIKNETEENVYRVIAREDILPGEQITKDNVGLVKVQNVVKTNNLVYRMYKDSDNRETAADTEQYLANVQAGKEKKTLPKDDRWAVGKIATSKIYKGEMIVADELKLPEEISLYNERIYSIPFDSSTTGGYNVKVGAEVDICLLYGETDEYQKPEKNKVIDIVLAKKKITDIRDAAGNSQIINPAVVPGYICFKLTYDEINKVELAKKQGKLFVGIPQSYTNEAHAETFMAGVTLPTFDANTTNP